MKTTIRITTITGFVITSLISGCGKVAERHMDEADKEIKNVSKDVKEAIINANEEAKQKAKEDWQKFKIESDHQITVMEDQANELKQKVAKVEKKEKTKLAADLQEADRKLEVQKEKLRQRNIDFEADVEKFDDSVVAKNESFKREFKHDMEELVTAFKDLFKNNVR